MPTYSLVVHTPGKVVRMGGQFVTVGAGRVVVGTGKSLFEASAWVRRSPRFRTAEEEVA